MLSDYEQITYGVPQGSVLGPTLFVVYINDLLLSLPDCSTMAYADDLTLTAFGDTIDKATLSLQESLTAVHRWSVMNFLHLNTAKCFIMHVAPSLRRRQPADIALRLGSHRLTAVQQLTILGVTISEDLSWSCHSRRVMAKISSRMAAIRRFGRCLNMKTRLLAFNAFVRPHLDYCLPVWGNTNATIGGDFDKVLLRCLQCVSGSRASDRYCFSATAPSHWNSLPNTITATDSLKIFKHKLFDFISNRFI
jgi:ribonuclease P/MRP protein subunit RPP40